MGNMEVQDTVPTALPADARQSAFQDTIAALAPAIDGILDRNRVALRHCLWFLQCGNGISLVF